ncbi:hypothetical protein [Tolypothrix sp. VBCCA 56010]|uniref:hypothetical protein n=1 Tax=Tolypothrix sp. VBCCA 56010 TaxID=3137731 RepID=UPI003D7C4A23
MGNGEWGMGHRASGIGHRASGIGHGFASASEIRLAFFYSQCPIPNAHCPMPNAHCPMPIARCPIRNRLASSDCRMELMCPKMKIINKRA